MLARSFVFFGQLCTVGILVVMLELPWALARHGAALVPMSSFGEDQLLLPWAYCSTGTGELIGEDLPMIIRLECHSINGID